MSKNRHFEIYKNCVDSAIASLNQAIYYMKKNNPKGCYPDTLFSLYSLKYFLYNERLNK